MTAFMRAVRARRPTAIISETTVHRPRTNMLDKLGLHDRVELVRPAMRNGRVEP